MDDYLIFMPEDHMDDLYNNKSTFIRNFHNSRLDKIVDFLPKDKKFKILDAGCGEGHLLEKIKNKRYDELFGADIHIVALKKARLRCPSAKISKQDLTNLKYKDNFFDIIICSGVIEHIPKYKEAIEEMKRVLRPGGSLIISIPNEPLWTICRFILGRKPAKIPDHINSFTPRTLGKEVKLKTTKKKFLPLDLAFGICLEGIIFYKK
jgi:ubiquinone/menaquinone biosynthesis C-methylase UbiE